MLYFLANSFAKRGILVRLTHKDSSKNDKFLGKKSILTKLEAAKIQFWWILDFQTHPLILANLEVDNFSFVAFLRGRTSNFGNNFFFNIPGNWTPYSTLLLMLPMSSIAMVCKIFTVVFTLHLSYGKTICIL